MRDGYARDRQPSIEALTDAAESERVLRASATDNAEFSCARDEGMNWVVLSVFITILISGAEPAQVNVMVSSTERLDAALASLVSSFRAGTVPRSPLVKVRYLSANFPNFTQPNPFTSTRFCNQNNNKFAA